MSDSGHDFLRGDPDMRYISEFWILRLIEGIASEMLKSSLHAYTDDVLAWQLQRLGVSSIPRFKCNGVHFFSKMQQKDTDCQPTLALP